MTGFEHLGDGAKGQGTTKWKKPLEFYSPPVAVPFPVEVFPPSVRSYIEGLSDAMGCPPDFLGGAVLAACSVAVGNPVSLAVKSDGSWEEKGNLWVGIVAPPGSMKSPAMDAVVKDLTGLGGGSGVGVVTDTTTEALGEALGEHAKGVLGHYDELTGLAGSLDQYKGGKGNDRQFYLSCWARQAIRKLRKGKGESGPRLDEVVVPDPYLTILGGLPPTHLSQLVKGKGATDGFLDRFLFCYPEEVEPCSWSDMKAMPEAAKESWQQVIKGLLNSTAQRTLRLSEEAEAAWAIHWDALKEEANDKNLPDGLKCAYSKLRGYAARLTVVLHVLWSPESDEVSAVYLPIKKCSAVPTKKCSAPGSVYTGVLTLTTP